MGPGPLTVGFTLSDPDQTRLAQLSAASLPVQGGQPPVGLKTWPRLAVEIEKIQPAINGIATFMFLPLQGLVASAPEKTCLDEVCAPGA